MLLLVLLYPLRKRISYAQLVAAGARFRWHMVLLPGRC
jgi:hypothetical protein